MREGIVDNSEFAICENLIYPVLKSGQPSVISHSAVNLLGEQSIPERKGDVLPLLNLPVYRNRGCFTQ